MGAFEKHHYVPRFLLANWHSGPDNRLSRMGWEHRKFIHERRSATICARKRGLYRVAGTTDPEIIESTFLGQLDNDAARVHQRFTEMDKDDFSSPERIAWSRFLSALMRRHPRFIKYLRRRAEEVYHQAVQDFKADQGSSVAEGFENWLADVGSIEAKNIGLTTVFPDLVNSELVNDAILKAHWKIRRNAPTHLDFLISDRPLIFGGKLDTSFLFALPLTPRHAFFAYNVPETGERLDRESVLNIIKKMNLATVLASCDHVFATSDRQARFIGKYLRRPELIAAEPPF